MPQVAKRVGALVQLARWKPLLSWGGSALLLGFAVAFSRVGMEVNLLHGGLAVLMVVLSQGFAAHGINDAYDWITGTDMESIGKGTGGSRVIPQGKMSVLGTLATASVGLIGVAAIAYYFILQYGTPMLVIGAIAVWAPVSYSTPPLKLGYRPFNEIATVLPALIGVVAAVDLVMAGSVSTLAIGVGWLHAMFCIAWFVVSRIPDYEPDRKVGKITSVVYVGRDNAKLLSASYLAFGLASIPLLAYKFSPAFVISVIPWGVMMVNLSRLDAYDEENASRIRLSNMHATSLNAIFLAVLLVVLGV